MLATRLLLVRLALTLGWFSKNCLAWSSFVLTKHRIQGQRPSLCMGLYDTPLPPRFPSPRDEDNSSKKKKNQQHQNDGNNDTDNDVVTTTTKNLPKLFAFSSNGTECHNLLPSLGRRLDRGIGCYYETSDRIVQNLAEQSFCHPEDAAWALDACKGDVTEAWTCISVAKRMALEQVTTTTTTSSSDQDNSNDDSEFLKQVKADLYDMMLEEDFQEMKQKRIQDDIERKRKEKFLLSDKDSSWLPKANPKPIDDEPWFTG